MQGFQIVVRDGGRGVNPGEGELEILLGGIFLPAGENLGRSDFDDSNLFQS